MEDDGRKEFEEKVRRGIFRPMERFVRHDLDDRRQEGLGQVWRTYQRNRELGKVLPDAVLAHAFRQRACDLGRQLVPGGRQGKDPLNPRLYHLGKVELVRLDGLVGEDGELEAEGDRDLALGLAEALTADPSAVIASALDLDRWMRELPDEDRTLLAMRFAGHTLAEIAEAFGVSISRVFARLKLLGLALAERAEIEVARSRRRKRRAPPGAVCAA
jgi:DNA-directed RNA polymerase specialized sigma24 family protein